MDTNPPAAEAPPVPRPTETDLLAAEVRGTILLFFLTVAVTAGVAIIANLVISVFG